MGGKGLGLTEGNKEAAGGARRLLQKKDLKL